MKAYLILEDGHVFRGTSIGAVREVISEIVFNTSMTGYVEALTDPSYAGEAVVMTYPLVGNAGVNEQDMESSACWPDAIIVREISQTGSNFRSEGTLNDFLIKYNIPGIAGIDTRMLTRLLRESGTMNGMLTTNASFNMDDVIEKLSCYKAEGVIERVTGKEITTYLAKDFIPTALEDARMTYLATPSMAQAISNAKAAGVLTGQIALASEKGSDGTKLLQKLTNEAEAYKAGKYTAEVYTEGEDKAEKNEAEACKAGKYAAGEYTAKEYKSGELEAVSKKAANYRVAMMDYGYKRSILHCLQRRGCDVTVYPAATKAEEVLAAKPDGILLSNGPGDPSDNPEIIAEIRKLCDSGIPVLAICLGHLMTALAYGMQTRKMTYGHRGENHPARSCETGKVYVTSQSHGYIVKKGTVDPEIAKVVYVNANDNSIEGLRYQYKPVLTVQFHPEASGGPHDTEFIFDEFAEMMEKKQHSIAEDSIQMNGGR